jgi:molecular chaperone HscB
MDMMEAREELSEAVRSKEVSKVAALGDAMRVRERAVVERLGRLFADHHDDQVLAVLGELRYVRRFVDEVGAFEETLLESPS